MAEDDTQADLGWIVENRYINHKSSLDVYSFIKQYDYVFVGRNGQGYRSSANILLGISFSLWRAVFLANLKKERTSLLDDTEAFLKELIDSNNISFGIDRKYKDWSFRYYMSNATYRLGTLSSKFAKQKYPFDVPGSAKGKTTQQEWIDAQVSLDAAIKSFGRLLSDVAARKDFAHVKKVKSAPKAKSAKR